MADGGEGEDEIQFLRTMNSQLQFNDSPMSWMHAYTDVFIFERS